MIHEHFKSEQVEYYILWLQEYHHGDPFPITDDIPKCSKGFSTRIKCIWDGSAIAELTGDEELWTKLPIELTGGSDPGYVHYIQGSFTQLQYIFKAFYPTLFTHEIGGDDNIFDYWPDLMCLAQAFAHDLDAIANIGPGHLTELRNAYLRFIETSGRVPEYNFDEADVDGAE